jgi:hypothetical protein
VDDFVGMAALLFPPKHKTPNLKTQQKIITAKGI